MNKVHHCYSFFNKYWDDLFSWHVFIDISFFHRKNFNQTNFILIYNISSTLLKETSEESQETADERVQAVIDVYEKRIKRIQRKRDDDDEWVSSLLFHQEEAKVQVLTCEVHFCRLVLLPLVISYFKICLLIYINFFLLKACLRFS